VSARQQRATAIPVGALLIAMVSIQYGATLAKSLFPAIGAQGTTGLRLAVAATMLIAVMRPWRSPPPRHAIAALLGYGASLGAMNLCFYMALRTIPLGIAVAIEFSGPLTVAVLASRRRTDFLWIALAIAGLLLLAPPFPTDHRLDPTGLLFAFAAGALWGLYIVFGQSTGRALGHQAATLGTIIAAALILPIGIAHAGRALLTPAIMLPALGVGLFSSAIPYSLEMIALTRLPATAYSTLTSLEPALGALLGLALLHEHLTPRQWSGILIVVIAACGAALSIKAPAVSPE
jgi:inner membrane transporter RhtA